MSTYQCITVMLGCTLSLLAWVTPPPAQAGTYHVATTGNDANPGTAASPWRTIQHAADVVGPGDTVTVRAGTYEEHVVMRTSGAPGKPITFTGESGAIIDGSIPLTGWVEDAGTCGSGCYRATPPAKAFWLGVGNQDIIRMVDFDSLNKEPAADYFSYYTNSTIQWWDGFEALWVGTGTPTGTPPAYTDGANPGNVWVRFRNRDNPNSKNMRVSVGGFGATVDFRNRSDITFQGFRLQGGMYALWLQNSSNITIEGNEITNGGTMVRVAAGSHHITVRNNVAHRNGLQGASDTLPGAFNHYNQDALRPARGTPQYDAAIKEKYYYSLKNFTRQTYNYFFTTDNTHDITIEGNEIYDLMGDAIDFAYVANIEIANNTIHNCSSVAILLVQDYRNVQIHDNLLYDCNILIRFLGLASGGAMQQVYIYRNRLWNPPGFGGDFYFHFGFEGDGVPASPHDIWIYHNSMEGGGAGLGIDIGGTRGVPNAHVINNIISAPYWAGAYGSLGDFAHNWIVGANPTSLAWRGPHNTLRVSNASFWDRAALPNFVMPNNSPARQTALDLSKPFTLPGGAFGPLPGMQPGYFTGRAPDPGALQVGQTAPSRPRPRPRLSGFP